ncbi:hypothetical protein HMPREF1870_01912 [Bacteroidales bacterium KA00344]|nr:hypothetical protein HMPREF1870_01912 [Bacteroidales bacterium KA00344]
MKRHLVNPRIPTNRDSRCKTSRNVITNNESQQQGHNKRTAELKST